MTAPAPEDQATTGKLFDGRDFSELEGVDDNIHTDDVGYALGGVAASAIAAPNFKQDAKLRNALLSGQDRLKESQVGERLAEAGKSDAARAGEAAKEVAYDEKIRSLDRSTTIKDATEEANRSGKKAGKAAAKEARKASLRATRTAAKDAMETGGKRAAAKVTGKAALGGAKRATVQAGARIGSKLALMAGAAAVPGPGWALAIGVGSTLIIEALLNDSVRNWIGSGIRSHGPDVDAEPSPPKTNWLPNIDDERGDAIRTTDGDITLLNAEVTDYDENDHRLWDPKEPGVSGTPKLDNVGTVITDLGNKIADTADAARRIYTTAPADTLLSKSAATMTPYFDSLTSFKDEVAPNLNTAITSSATTANNTFQYIRDANAQSRETIAKSRGKWLHFAGRATVDQTGLRDNREEVQNSVLETKQASQTLVDAVNGWNVGDDDVPLSTKLSGIADGGVPERDDTGGGTPLPGPAPSTPVTPIGPGGGPDHDNGDYDRDSNRDSDSDSNRDPNRDSTGDGYETPDPEVPGSDVQDPELGEYGGGLDDSGLDSGLEELTPETFPEPELGDGGGLFGDDSTGADDWSTGLTGYTPPEEDDLDTLLSEPDDIDEDFDDLFGDDADSTLEETAPGVDGADSPGDVADADDDGYDTKTDVFGEDTDPEGSGMGTDTPEVGGADGAGSGGDVLGGGSDGIADGGADSDDAPLAPGSDADGGSPVDGASSPVLGEGDMAEGGASEGGLLSQAINGEDGEGGEHSVEIDGNTVDFPNQPAADLASDLTDGGPETNLRDAAAAAGFEVPGPGEDIGSAISPSELQPGDVVSGSEGDFLFIGDDQVIGEDGQPRDLAEVAKFDGEHQGFFRMDPGEAGDAPTPTAGSEAADVGGAPSTGSEPTEEGVTSTAGASGDGSIPERRDDAPIGFGAHQMNGSETQTTAADSSAADASGGASAGDSVAGADSEDAPDTSDDEAPAGGGTEDTADDDEVGSGLVTGDDSGDDGAENSEESDEDSTDTSLIGDNPVVGADSDVASGTSGTAGEPKLDPNSVIPE